jgi:predicted nucleic acid-binding protein
MSGPPSAPIAILDTNALLDWRVFKDPAAHPIAQAIIEGRLRWLACPSMEQEWHQVWPRSYLKRWAPDPMLTLTVFQHAQFVDEPPRGPLRCKDPDDQVFIDLALHVGATWLFSKDAALLKLAGRARQRTGLQVIRLPQWVADQAASADKAAPT